MELVVGASEATMKSLLSKLGGLLAHEYALIRGVRGDLQYINDEMASMQAFLGDLSSTAPQGHDRRVKDWMKQIRDVTYDIEDSVDDFAHRLSHDPGSDICCAFIVSSVYEVWTWRPRRDIASNISELKVRAQQIGERRIRYGVENPMSGSQSDGAVIGFMAAENQETSLELVGTKKPVGVDKDMKELGEWVILQSPATAAAAAAETTPPHDPSSDRPTSSQAKPDHGVLSIVGFGGVGKTTMATALYQKFGDQFDCRAMVTVSQSPDIEAILRIILRQVRPQSRDVNEQQRTSSGGTLQKNRFMAAIGSLWSKDHLDNEQRGGSMSEIAKDDLKNHLEEHSYLILVDDVWSTSMWEKIKMSLPKSKKGSRVIVTTRFQAVASACRRDKGDRVHKVVVLTDDKPEELFMTESKMSLENRKKIPSRLWQMCGGLPLAIVTMAGHAACNPDRQEDEWKRVCTSLVPDSGKALAQEGVTRILSHCYNDMPAEIKTCSLYLCIFPKGRKVSRKRLTRRWLAEGFVSERDGLSVEDVAETYFNHLVRRKIIRAVEHSSNGKVKSYQVHDMVLEYIVSKASEENYVTVVGGHWLMAPPSNKVRRLSLHGGDAKHRKTMESMNFSHVRSLTLFESLSQLPSNSLKFGIVLDLEGCMDFEKQHAKEICKMLLLKYLSLRRTDVEKIPKKIGKLQYLETIDIRETNVTELPNTVCQLERLVNILGGNKRTRKALKLPEDLKKETMKSLRILSGIEIAELPTTAVADLHHLTDLRKLAIYKLNITNESNLFKDLSSSIEYLGGYSLHTLIINDVSSEFLKSLSALSSPPMFLNALELSGDLVELPKWITELDALTKLTLSGMAVSTDTLHRLSKLKTLFSLTFSLNSAKSDPHTATTMRKNKSGPDGEIIVPASGFEELKLLRFSAPFMPLLSFPNNAMPKLERLELKFSYLEGMRGIENLQDLEEVHLTMHDEAGDVTKFMVDDMSIAAREYDQGPRIIVDQYHE